MSSAELARTIDSAFERRDELAPSSKGVIREAVEHEYARARSAIPLTERLRPIQEELRSLSKPGGSPADKAFFDELSGEI